ncbi:MAG: hypothetical protein AAFP69_15630, partial [Planctomycetota bacterium]
MDAAASVLPPTSTHFPGFRADEPYFVRLRHHRVDLSKQLIIGWQATGRSGVCLGKNDVPQPYKVGLVRPKP